MYTFNNIDDLQALIDNVVEEHTELEYKLCFGDTDEECNNGVKQPCGGKKIGELNLSKMLLEWLMLMAVK